MSGEYAAATEVELRRLLAQQPLMRGAVDEHRRPPEVRAENR
jgi:hypothetical protein